MIEIVTPENRTLYQSLLADMYRMRYEVVVEKWGWTIPSTEEGVDRDSYDTDDTVYILHLNRARNKVQGCCRLNPTTAPNMLSELYAQSCDLQPVPCSSTIWEASRFIVSPHLRSREQYHEVMWRLGVGMAEYCLLTGIEKVAWYTNPPFYNTINSAMRVEPLGRPKFNVDDNDTYIPALASVDATSLRAMRSRLADPSEKLCFTLAPILNVFTNPQPANVAAV